MTNPAMKGPAFLICPVDGFRPLKPTFQRQWLGIFVMSVAPSPDGESDVKDQSTCR